MSSQHAPSSETVVCSPAVRLSKHARQRYAERTPDDAIAPELAWQRGEDVAHPEVARLVGDGYSAPDRIRVYNHNHDWFAIFVVLDDLERGDQCAVTVYNHETHEHGPTRAYLHSHGPHYREDGGKR